MKYYIGLDMGTSSLGWAVTDDKYRLLKKEIHSVGNRYFCTNSFIKICKKKQNISMYTERVYIT